MMSLLSWLCPGKYSTCQGCLANHELVTENPQSPHIDLFVAGFYTPICLVHEFC